jgi:hypothetical protein
MAKPVVNPFAGKRAGSVRVHSRRFVHHQQMLIFKNQARKHGNMESWNRRGMKRGNEEQIPCVYSLEVHPEKPGGKLAENLAGQFTSGKVLDFRGGDSDQTNKTKQMNAAAVSSNPPAMASPMGSTSGVTAGLSAKTASAASWFPPSFTS